MTDGGVPQPPPAGRRPAWPWLALAAVGLLAGVLALRARAVHSPAPGALGTLPHFALTERSGRPLTRADLLGSVWVADFIFTRCAGVCPAMTARMSLLRRELPAEVRLVTFTVDPGHDTPAMLRRYAQQAHAADGWLFATGPAAELYALATDGFKLAAYPVPPDEQRQGGDGPFLHSSKFVLVDAAARIRGYYDGLEDAAMARLATDVKRVCEERE